MRNRFKYFVDIDIFTILIGAIVFLLGWLAYTHKTKSPHRNKNYYKNQRKITL